MHLSKAVRINLPGRTKIGSMLAWHWQNVAHVVPFLGISMDVCMVVKVYPLHHCTVALKDIEYGLAHL